ncbi:MAG: bifunctional phosphoribosylaminoimidazolecarboxamide formyltransferase/IMP cyclohydrolase [Alphaproteobacteria bacterium]|nr:bifunctional phosphoribosylaminoimidazolecarboxamide formyltransferase/IMP cyclohydrolase [Alphaproteobacteria bacterium]
MSTQTSQTAQTAQGTQKAHPVRRALISVSDKTGIIEFARALHTQNIELISTGGTAQHIAQAKLPVKDIADLTGFPEIMDGRVKTLHPIIYGGLLAKQEDNAHAAAMQAHNMVAIDLLVVNLYPFQATVAAGADYDSCVEQIDIGGPAMIRAAAKNHDRVIVLTEQADYARLLDALAAHKGCVPFALRQELAQKAYAYTAAYDAAITNWLAKQKPKQTKEKGQTEQKEQTGQTEHMPAFYLAGGRLRAPLRYGENPHQAAALYLDDSARAGAATAQQIQGKPLSYNNINDSDAAFELVCEFDPNETAACAIIKHANPCGVAKADRLEQAFTKALNCDPMSAYGGIIALNRPLDAPTAKAITEIFTEVIIAPQADETARALIAKKKNLRLLITGEVADWQSNALSMRSIAGGYLVQTRDNGRITKQDLQVVTKRQPTQAEIDDMLFAFCVAKHVKSNAIVYATQGATIGIGAGQMSRIDSARIASHKAQIKAQEAQEAQEAQGTQNKQTTIRANTIVAASDAFFPFADGLEQIAESGIQAIIQPGGAKRDEEIIAAANQANLTMVFTNMRHFRH